MTRRPSSVRASLAAGPAGVSLNSWKEIAAHLGTSVRTVQRWEEIEGLPVHRHEHASVSTVYAYVPEVDVWLKGRRVRETGSRSHDRLLDVQVRPASPDNREPAPRRLIVLPFRLLQVDPEIEFLAFGLSDAITMSLSGLDSLRVRSSLVAGRYAGHTDLEHIASEAVVDLILTGTLLRSGDQLRVGCNLWRPPAGRSCPHRQLRSDFGTFFSCRIRLCHG